MTLDQGAVSVRLEATSPAAQGLLTEHLAMLRGSLESRGLTIDKLSVQYAPAQSGAAAAVSSGSGHASAGASQHQYSQQSAEPNSSWQDAAGEQSRGRRDRDEDGAGGGAGSPAENEVAGAAQGGEAIGGRFGGRLRLRLETVA